MNFIFKEVVWIEVNEAEPEALRTFFKWTTTNKIYPAVVAGSTDKDYFHFAYTKENAEKIKNYWGELNDKSISA